LSDSSFLVLHVTFSIGVGPTPNVHVQVFFL
jgi:hypothetical protein